MRWPLVILAALALFPAAAIGLYFLAGDVEALASPQWTGSQTRGSYILMMLAVKGALFAAIGVAAWGILSQNKRVTLVGAGALAVAAFPLLLGSGGIVVLLSAGMVLFVGIRPPRVGSSA